MKIQDLLNKKVMLLDLQATTKEAAIDEMINSLVDNGVVTDFDVFKAGIMAREAQTSTGLGDGIAMPHSKNAAVKEATVLFAQIERLKKQGVAIIYISHKMDEIFRISDTITVLRDGQWIGTKPAKEAGVNVVIVNQRISDPEAADCYVGADAATTGSKLMEEVMKDIDGKGNVALLLGPMGSDGQVGRSEGFDQVLADYPDVTVAFQDTAEWQTEPALTIVENWLNAGKEISAVVAQNDSMAVGAAKAIADAQKTGEIKVYGIDATSEGLQAVLDGKLQGTMAQGTADQGKFAADACADLLDGKEVDSETIVDNVYYTADNAQEALDAIAK